MRERDPAPGETPLDDISGLLLRHVKTHATLNAGEAANIAEVLPKYLGAKPDGLLAPFDLSWCYQLHGEMFGRVWAWAGAKRTSDLNLGSPHYQIDVELQSLLDELHFWQQNSSMPLPEQAAHLHHRAVRIHPFLNGNGRWSRLLANIWLAQHDAPVVLWPESMIGVTSVVRGEYLDAIRAADAGNIRVLMEMHARYATPLPD